MTLSQSYHDGIKLVPIMTPMQEIETFRKYIDTGRPAAIKNRIVSANLRLVIKIAGQFRLSPGMDFEDLVGEGNLGLIDAVDRFDPAYGIRFNTYACYWIRRYVRYAIFNQARTIRIPVHIQNTLFTYRTYWRYLEEQLQRAPTRNELAAALRLTSGRALTLDLCGAGTDGYFDLDGENGFIEFAEGQTDTESEYEALERMTELHDAIARLRPQERAVIELRYLGSAKIMTFIEIGRRLGFTYQRAQQLERKGMKKLRKIMKKSVDIDRVTC